MSKKFGKEKKKILFCLWVHLIGPHNKLLWIWNFLIYMKAAKNLVTKINILKYYVSHKLTFFKNLLDVKKIHTTQ